MKRARKLAALAAAATMGFGAVFMMVQPAYANAVIRAGITMEEPSVGSTTFPLNRIVGTRMLVQNIGTSDYQTKNLKVLGCNAYTKMVGADIDNSSGYPRMAPSATVVPTPDVLSPGEGIYIYCGVSRSTPGFAGVNILMGDSASFQTQELAVFEWANPAFTGNNSIANNRVLGDSVNIGQAFTPIDGGLSFTVQTTHSISNIVEGATSTTFIATVSSHLYSDLAVLNPTLSGCTAIDPQPVMMPGHSQMFECSVPKGVNSYSLTFNGPTINGAPVTQVFTGSLGLSTPTPTPDPDPTPTPTPDPDPTEDPVAVIPTPEADVTATYIEGPEPMWAVGSSFMHSVTVRNPSETDSVMVGLTLNNCAAPQADPANATLAPGASKTWQCEVVITEGMTEATATLTTLKDGNEHPVAPVTIQTPEDPIIQPLSVQVSGGETLKTGEVSHIAIAVTNPNRTDSEPVEVSIPGCTVEQTVGTGNVIDAQGTFVWGCDIIPAPGVTSITPMVTIGGVKQDVPTFTVDTTQPTPTPTPTVDPTVDPTDTPTPDPTPDPTPTGTPTVDPTVTPTPTVDPTGTPTPTPTSTSTPTTPSNESAEVKVIGPSKLKAGETGRITIAVTNHTDKDFSNVVVGLGSCKVERIDGIGTKLAAGETGVWACDYKANQSGEQRINPDVVVDGNIVKVAGLTLTVEDNEPSQPIDNGGVTPTTPPTTKPSTLPKVGD